MNTSMSPNLSNLCRAAAVAMFALTMVAATTSTAMARPSAPADIEGKFKMLDARKKRGVLTVNYTISGKSWKRMQRAGIRPRLNLHLPNAQKTGYVFTYSTRLKGRKGQIIYPQMNLRGMRTAEISLVGFEGPHRVYRTRYGRDAGRRVRIAMVRRGGQVHNHPHTGNPNHDHPHTDHHHPAPRPQGWRAQAINACKAQTRYDSEFNGCVKRAVKLNATDAALVVNACGKGTRYASGLNSCLDKALNLAGQRHETIRACDATTKYDSELNNCLNVATKFNYGAGAVIRACGAQTRYASEQVSCMKQARTLRARHAAATVEACGKATRFNGGMLVCMKNAGSLGGDRYALIRACGQSTRYDNQFNQCLTESSQPVRGPRVRRASHRR